MSAAVVRSTYKVDSFGQSVSIYRVENIGAVIS